VRKLSRKRALPRPHLTAEHRIVETVRPLELFFDLVFVLGFTQCTALMIERHSWEGIATGVLALGLLWWAWVGYSWLTSVIDPEEGIVRLAMFAAMAAMLVAALALPHGFGAQAEVFVVAYSVVRMLHGVLFVVASREDRQLRHSVVTHTATTLIALVGLAVGTRFEGDARTALWALSLAFDVAGPALVGISGWQLVPAHFAERHNLVIILALGESVIALGAGSDRTLPAGVVVGAVLGIALAAAYWWTYFDVVWQVNARRLSQAEEGRVRNAYARDCYSYLHFPLVAGIILTALGIHEVLAHHDEPLDLVHAFALVGGVAIYLLGHVGLRLRGARSLNKRRLVIAVAALLLFPLATRAPALVVLAAVNVPLWVLITIETRGYGQVRYDLRHQVESSP
jgi:low temperature requirement protein LtrA